MDDLQPFMKVVETNQDLLREALHDWDWHTMVLVDFDESQQIVSKHLAHTPQSGTRGAQGFTGLTIERKRAVLVVTHLLANRLPESVLTSKSMHICFPLGPECMNES